MPANIMQKYSCKTREGPWILPGKFRLGSSSVYLCLGNKFVCCCIHNVYHFLLRSCADPIWSVPVMSLLILPLLSLSLLDLIPLLSVSFSAEDRCPWFCFFLHPVRPTCSLVLFTCPTVSQPRLSRRGPLQITHFKMFASLASPRNDATLW